MNKNSILVVEDDRPIRNLIITALKTHDYKYLEAENGTSAILEASSHNPDIVLLDLGLPDIEGVEVIKKIRMWSNMPIIVISARNEDTDKIEALDAGADDYITKPFEIREVLARVQVQLRRKEEKETGIECDLSFKDMVLNRDTFQVRIDGRILSKITKQEFAILELLLRNPKQVFSKEDIFEYAWDEPYMGETKTLDVHISNIRKKIKQVTSDEYIETVWGIGYRLHA